MLKVQKQTVALIFLTSKQVSCITRNVEFALMLKFFKFKQFSYLTVATEKHFHTQISADNFRKSQAP